jgi:hypothetical protein
MPTPSPPTTTPTREPVPAGDGGAPNRREVSAECSAPTCSSRPRSARRPKPPRRSGGSTCVVGGEQYAAARAVPARHRRQGLAASGAPADPGLAGSSSLSRAVISRICAGRPSRSGRWRHAGLAGRSGRGTTQQASMNAKPKPHGAPTVLRGSGACRTSSESGPRHPRRVASARSSALAGAAANPVDRHPLAAAPPARHSRLAYSIGSCRCRREGPGGPGEGSGEPCRSGGS